MSRYLDRLKQDKDAKAAAAAVVSEAQAKASVEQKIAGLKAQAATLTAAYEAALGAVPFSVEKVVSLTKEQADNTAELGVVQGILDSEFA